MKLDIIFLTIAGKSIGMGHLNRLRILQSIANEVELKTFLLQFVEDADLNSSEGVYPIEDLFKEEQLDWKNYCRKFDAIVFDISHPRILANVSCFQQLFDWLNSNGLSVFIIDSPGEASLYIRLSKTEKFVFFMPYVGGSAGIPKANNIFEGKEFAILGDEYGNLPDRIISQKANKILLTFGGSDPTELTLLGLDALQDVNINLELKVVIGHFYSNSLRAKIKNKVDSLEHPCLLIESISSLKELMLWCDVAVSASGLTKYELAVTGTPSIIISIDEFHHAMNRSFSALDTFIDLGVCRDSKLISNAIVMLIDNFNARKELSNNGINGIDGKGCLRIIELIRRIGKNS